MINFPKRRSAKPAQPQSLPKDAKLKKSSVLAGFRPSSFGGRRGGAAAAVGDAGGGDAGGGGAAAAAAASKTMLWKQRYIAHEVEEEKKDDAADVAAVKGERELELVRELVREHQVTPSTPVDLDVTLDDYDNSNDNSNNDEGVAFQDDVCLLFQEDDEEDHNQDAEEVGLQSVELPAQLLRAPRGSPGRPVAVAVPNLLNLLNLRDQPPTVTTDMTTPKKTRPPTEINIDMHAVPPSPMRDPNISRQPQHQPPSQPDDLLNHYRCRSPSPPAEMDAFAFGLQSQLCDAERLVRVILGKNYQSVPVPVPASSQQPQHQSLDNGSILQAIQRFAVMQQELVELRRQVETNDGDPPAILTNLTSPATTRNASSLSTTPSSMPPSTTIPRNLSSSLSPHSQDQNQNHHNHYRNTTTPSSVVSVSNSSPQSLKTARNALVLAARKCQALESHLKRANERVEELELELEFQVQSHEQSQSSSQQQQQQQQQQRIQALEAENRTLLAQRQPTTAATSTSFSHTPAEVEAILTKLHSIPAKSVSQDERQRIRQYVLDMLQHTSAEKAATTSISTIAPPIAPEEWKAAQAQMGSLQTQLVAADHRAKNHHFSRHVHELESELYLDHDRHDDEDEEGVTNPLQVAKRQIRQRTARIAELEASHVRLQSLLHLALRETPRAQTQSTSPPQPQHQHQQPLQDETNKPIPVKSGRFAKLEEEHQALVESLRILEDQDVQL